MPLLRGLVFFLCFSFSLGSLQADGSDVKGSRPNIILIMCDDMGWSDIGCYGGEVRTPHLDRLAAEGLRFRQFYNNAKCTTTRASLVTGLYPRRGKGGLLRRNMVTLGEALKLAGYQTVLSGKWHLGKGKDTHPFHRGFDEFYGLLDGCSNFFNPVQPDPKYKGGRIRSFGHNDKAVKEFPKDYYTTDAFTDHAIETIGKYVEKKRPFFLHLTYTAPHYPLHALPDDIANYRGKYLKGWDVMRKKRYERQLAMGLIDKDRYPLSETDSRSYDWEKSNKKFEDHRMAVYAAMIDRMDQNIGKLMAALKQHQVDDNTIVIFFSDNGGCAEEPGGRDPKKRNPGPADDYVAVGPAWGWAQNAPFKRYKVWMHEGGINTPCIVRWPNRVPSGKITDEVGHIIDIMPTFLELAGLDYPKQYEGNQILPCEGKSLVPVLLGSKRKGHKELYWEFAGNRAARQGDWKLTWDKIKKKWELFDMSTDRTETRDVSGSQQELTNELKAKWFQWAKETGLKVKPTKKKKKKSS